MIAGLVPAGLATARREILVASDGTMVEIVQPARQRGGLQLGRAKALFAWLLVCFLGSAVARLRGARSFDPGDDALGVRGVRCRHLAGARFSLLFAIAELCQSRRQFDFPLTP
jgi:hypothetical protein